ncbi:MAG TPA: hypothetical protein VFZ17_03810 [Acidimicrobiia bacterium]|nr:hypothetical protein [Acidimicrobiia bacterium]
MPNLIPDWLPWMRPAGRLIWASLFLVIGLAIVFVLMKRPKPNRPATWAECMAGAVGVLALMTLAYAVIPHEWITFSDKYLQWDTTKFVVRSGQDFALFKFPFDINQQAVRDVVATGIYVVMVGLNLFLFSKWQKRGQVDETAATDTPKVSRFGRPLRRAKRTDAPVAGGGAEALEPEPAGAGPVGAA